MIYDFNHELLKYVITVGEDNAPQTDNGWS